MRLVWAALVAAALVAPALGEPEPSLRVEFSNPALTPAHWSLVLRPDGNGHFHSERGSTPASGLSAMEPVIIDRDIWLSPAFAGRIFDVIRRHNLLRGERCESHLKVAFEGWKKLSYSGPDGSGECEFNFSKDKELQALGESMVGVAYTIVEGARVEMLLQHDPLGLDRELEFIQQGVQDGRLQQICVIRSTLEKLEGDPAVMERVRRRARALLARIEQ
ncbi:MAG: hypothetical protein P4L40_23990 [Terracidiphilus sp.]|nr:hypothetical protein [Terracidiphilus sp.]